MINLVLLVFLISINFSARSTPSVPKYRIIGQRYAAAGEFPYLVSIREYETYKSLIFCSGSIINESFILTAAHCTFSTDKRDIGRKYNPSDLMIVAGQIETDITATSVVRKVKNIVRHPRYDTKLFLNDLAIFELEEKLPMTDLIKPITLSQKRAPENVKCSVPGWGSTGYDRETRKGVGDTEICKKATVRALDPETCKKKNGAKPNDASICVEGIIGKDGKRENLCTGDSGGPMVCNGFNTGICSFGINGCIQGVMFIDVAYYLPWIQYQHDKPGIPPRKRRSGNGSFGYGFRSSSKLFCRNKYFYFLLIAIAIIF